LSAISSMMFATEEKEYDEVGDEHNNSHPNPAIDDVISEGLMDMESSSDFDEAQYVDQMEQVTEAEHDEEGIHIQQALYEIPFEYRNGISSEYLPLDADAADLVKGSIPYEYVRIYDNQFFRQQEGRPHHILFDIPYEDCKVKPTVDNVEFEAKDHLNDIPYEHDTVTTSSSDSLTHGGENTEVDGDVNETKNGLGSMPVEVDDSDDALRSLFESLGDCHEAEPGMSNDIGDHSSEEQRKGTALAGLVKSLNNDEILPVPNNYTNEMAYEDGKVKEEEEEECIEEFGLGWLPGFTVNVEVRPTPHLGVDQYGVFALQDIPAKHLVWKWTRRLQAYHYSELETYIQANYQEDDLEGIRTFLRRGVVPREPSDSHFVSALTDSIGFMNCSASPNCRHQRATRYIYKGEELTLDYSFYSNPQWYVNVCHKYGIMTGPEIAERQARFGDDRFFTSDYMGDNTAEMDAWLARYFSQVG
jgi:hypothetical protein